MNGMTKTEQAYRVLRRAIVIGDLPEDTPLDDAALTERYGFGRTPLREAMKKLSDEQFVNYPPHRTPYVRGVRVMELAKLYQARHLLEEPVARIAARTATLEQIGHLARLCRDMETLIEDGNVYESVELDHQFHLAVAQATDNRFLSEAVNRLNCGSLRLWYLANSRLGMEDLPAHHWGIQQAIGARDADGAVQVVAAHIDNSYRRQIEQQQLDMRVPIYVNTSGERRHE